MAARFLNLFILFVMGINGALYLAWFLSPPNPDRIGFWFLIYFIVFPVLGCSGLLALAQSSTLRISKWVGGILLLYVGILTVMANAFSLGLNQILAFLPQGGFEALHVLLFAVTLIGLLVLMFRR